MILQAKTFTSLLFTIFITNPQKQYFQLHLNIQELC